MEMLLCVDRFVLTAALRVELSSSRYDGAGQVPTKAPRSSALSTG